MIAGEALPPRVHERSGWPHAHACLRVGERGWRARVGFDDLGVRCQGFKPGIHDCESKAYVVSRIKRNRTSSALDPAGWGFFACAAEAGIRRPGKGHSCTRWRASLPFGEHLLPFQSSLVLGGLGHETRLLAVQLPAPWALVVHR